MPLLKNLQVFNALKVPWKVTLSFSPGKKNSVVPRFAKLNKRSPKYHPPPPSTLHINHPPRLLSPPKRA